MKIAGIVAEYNPFHNGHLYHLEKTREKTGCDYVVAILSSSFVQRGEPGIFSKWQRAEMAVANGVDLVLELPAAFSCRSAYYFALGSIYSLHKCNVVSHLAFGVEAQNLEQLQAIASLLNEEPFAYRDSLHKYLKEGVSYPKARDLAIREQLPALDFSLNQPNVILGISYLRILQAWESSITPVTIQRLGGYHSLQPEDNIAGATLVRNLMEEQNPLYSRYLTAATNRCIEGYVKNGWKPVFMKDFDPQLLYRLRSLKVEELKKYPGIGEGLENRLGESLFHSCTSREILDFMKNKRYSDTRLKRILSEVLLNMPGDINSWKPLYLRPLAFSDKGREVLGLMQEKSDLPVISKFADFYHQACPAARKMLDWEIQVTNIYHMVQPARFFSKYHLDFTHSPGYLSGT